jgi:hypothetical protein
MNNQDDDKDKGMPSYYGKAMPANPKMMMDDDVEETTRRVGGRGVPSPSMIAPNMAPMAMPFGNPAMMGHMGPSFSTAPTKGPVVATQSQGPPKFVWSLPAVPTLPEFHPLERTAVFVPNTPPPVISQRISDVLRERSIEAAYENDKGKAKCVTTDGVNFRIRLYRGRNRYSHGIIVEVQRRYGSSIHFHSDIKAILDAAEGKVPSPPSPTMNVLPMVSDDEDFAPPTTGASSLVMVSKMLSLPGYDAQSLGLQTLSSLVDEAKMGLLTARNVSKELLKIDNEVGRRVFTLIMDRSSEDETAVGLRVMALNIFANALKATGSVPGYLREPLRPVLLEDLTKSESHPRTAFMAAMCMERFIAGDHDSMELTDAFEAALAAGQSRHASLMRQAQRCLSMVR